MTGEVRCQAGGVTFVIAGGDRVLALHGPEIEPFPFSLVLAGGELGDLAPGEEVSVAEGLVRVGAVALRAVPPRGPLTVPALVDHPALFAALSLRPAVAERRRAVASVLDPAEEALAGGDAEEVVRLLLGWGPGLTPSGDDVLLGMAAAARLRGERQEATTLLTPATARADGGTTFVSRALLEFAACGRFAPALGALSTADPAARVRAIERIARIGAHSGLDLLVGVEAGLRAYY